MQADGAVSKPSPLASGASTPFVSRLERRCLGLSTKIQAKAGFWKFTRRNAPFSVRQFTWEYWTTLLKMLAFGTLFFLLSSLFAVESSILR